MNIIRLFIIRVDIEFNDGCQKSMKLINEENSASFKFILILRPGYNKL